MNAKLHKNLRHLDDDLSKLLEELKNYSESDLNRAPKPGAWSALQVMHHLMLAESTSQQYVEKKLSFNPPLKRKGILNMFRFGILSFFMKSPFRKKAPDGLGDSVIPEQSSFWETAKKWKAQRESLALYLENLPAEYVSKEIYKHPAAGRLILPQMLLFFHDHFRRHRKQIRKALIFPPSRNK